MKKLNLLLRHFILLFLFCVFAIFFAGCKTVPTSAEKTVHAVELLDDGNAFFIAAPSSADSVLIERIIKNNVPNLSDSNVKMICGRIEKIYCGLNRTKNGTDFQCIIEGDIPIKMVPKILTEKNGWKKNSFYPENSAREYKIYNYDSEKINLDMAFLSNNLVCIGRGIRETISRFDYLKNLPKVLEKDDSFDLDVQISTELANFLCYSENEIRFCADKPQSFLTILTGMKLDLKLNEVRGAFVLDSKNENQYILNLDFYFKNEKYLKAGKTLLSLAFGLTNSQIIIAEPDVLKIKEIKLEKNQLYKLLVL